MCHLGWRANVVIVDYQTIVAVVAVLAAMAGKLLYFAGAAGKLRFVELASATIENPVPRTDRVFHFAGPLGSALKAAHNSHPRTRELVPLR